MSIDFTNIVRNNFTDLAFKVNETNIRRAEFGFVSKDCDFVKSLLSTICLHSLDNPDIFTEEQSNNIMDLINMLSNG